MDRKAGFLKSRGQGQRRSVATLQVTTVELRPLQSELREAAHAVEGGQAVQPGPGPRAGGSVHTPHQPLRRGRGGIAPAAARRPAASPAPTGQERSPRPPSGCRGQFSGDSARPSAADLSQLAFAAQLSNIHLWDFSPAAPFHEPGRGRGIPSGGLSSLSEKRAGERQREQCVTGPPTGTLCSVSPLRVPNGPRGKGRSGCPLTSENPRHGRLRLRGARDRGSNRCLRAGRGTVQAPAGPGSARLRGGGCRSPGGGGEWDFFFFLPAFLGVAVKGARLGDSSQGKRRGVVSWPPRRSRHFPDPARRTSGGTASPGTLVLAGQPLPGSSRSQSSDSSVPRPKCLPQRMSDWKIKQNINFPFFPGTRTRSALSRPGAEWSRVGCPPARPPPAARCHVLAVAAPSD
ncbi:translation initiation factor IF-2-like [Ursus maritimus]|uniref:Translation initiation factor IF-2-like n=1 Tax=Ursus maritimus TaxID=29073 RepID=A0A8M1FPX3_URSMA|nr:translation initiation factor IF-2-like [Ursus maritimus]